MTKRVSCGMILLLNSTDIALFVHPTGGKFRFDFPKGMAEQGEDHLNAAVRELYEETSIVFDELNVLKGPLDLGYDPDYASEKGIRMFIARIEVADPIEWVKTLKCSTSMFSGYGYGPLPECDGFKLSTIEIMLTPKSGDAPHMAKQMVKYLNDRADILGRF